MKWRERASVAWLFGALLCGQAASASGQTCAASSVVYDMSGPTCPNGDERCNFSTGMHFYQPEAGAPGVPVVLMPTGYDLHVFKVTSLTSTAQSWQQLQSAAFAFATQYRSLNRILLEVDVDPSTGLGIAPYQDKPVRIFEMTSSGTVQEVWRNPHDGSFPNTGTAGVIFSLPAGTGRRHFAAWMRNSSLEFFEIIPGSPTQVVSRLNTTFEFIKVTVRRGNPAYIYGVDALSRAIRVLRAELVNGSFQLTETATLTPFSQASDGLDAFAGLALDPTTGRLYSSAHKVVNATKTYVECWETAANPASPTYRSRLLIPGSRLSRTLAAHDGWVVATSTDPLIFFNNPLSFHTPDAPQVIPTWSTFPRPLQDQRYLVGPNGVTFVRDAAGNFGAAFADVEWAAMAWLNPACANATPMAGVGVTRATQSGTPQCSASNVAAHGFPGDSFTLKDESTGSNYTVTSLRVSGVDAHNSSYHWQATPPGVGGSVQWPGTETRPLWGRFRVSLTITRPDQSTDTATKDLYLCEQPVARVAVTATKRGSGSWAPCTSCSWLRGDSLKISAAASDGHPELAQTQWAVEWRANPQESFTPLPAQDGSVVNWEVNPQGEVELALHLGGEYKASAEVVYAFNPTQPRPAATGVLVSAAVFPSVRVEQPQGTVVPEGGTVRSTPPVLLVAQTQTASGWSVTGYAWKVERGGVEIATGTSPQLEVANLVDNSSYLATLTVTASSGSDQETAAARRTFDVRNVTGSFTWAPTSPQIGEETSFSPVNVSGGVTSLRWTFGSDPLCDGTGPQITRACILGTCVGVSVRFAQGGTRTVTLEALVGSIWALVSSQQVTVQSSGSCVTCTAPSAPALNLPATGATVNVNQPVTFSWGPASGTGPIEYTLRAQSQFRNETCTTQGNSCNITFTVGGTYTWWVQASNSCGTTASGNRTLTVQSSTCTPPDAPAPVAPAAGATLQAGPITFSWQGVTGATGYSVQLKRAGFPAGSCSPTPATGTSCSITVTGAGSYTWSVTANNSCGSAASAERPFTVSSPCGTLAAPGLLEPAEGATVNGASVTFRWQAPAQGQGPFTYDVYVDTFRRAADLSDTQHTVQNVAAGAHTWYVVAKDACAQSAQSQTRGFNAISCTVAAPEPNFTWEPRGEDPFFPQQMQPYAGQEVTLIYTGTGGPPEYYKWYDFHQTPPKVVEGPNLTQVKHTWSSVSGAEYQDMNVRLGVRNCAGAPPDLLKPVRVYKDIRPVLAKFSTAGSLVAGQPVRFVAAAGRSEGNPNRFEWDFGDGSAKVSGTEAEVEHTYACGRTYQVTLTVWRGTTKSSPLTKGVMVGGKPCAPLALVVPDVALRVQSTYALWLSRLRLFNPEQVELTTQVVARTRDHRQYSGELTVPPQGSRSLEDVVQVLRDGQGQSPTENLMLALWFTARAGQRLPLVGARTFTEPAGGGTYGQAVPLFSLYPADLTPTVLWVEGAEHNGTTNGFRTNLTVINPSEQGWGSSRGITLTLISEKGRTYSKRLEAFGGRGYFRFNPITNVFDLPKEEDLGDFTLKVEVDAGVQALVGCSVNDNLTNDSFFLLAQPDTK